MIETPLQFVERTSGAPVGTGVYPAEDLRRFSYHTGAPLTRLADDEPCPILFRDVGLEGMTLFLRGQMRRLAGPLSPIIYTRTADYVEPYHDYGRIGRLIILRPMELRPWHSGVPTIYVARSTRMPADDAMAFVPAEVPLAAAADLAAPMRTGLELREALGGRDYDDRAEETLGRVVTLTAELAESERYAAPLRQALQSADPRTRDRAMEEMTRLGLTEGDVCSAYHHLPPDRRAVLREVLPEVRLGSVGGSALQGNQG
jgi:hypothetical protein